VGTPKPRSPKKQHFTTGLFGLTSAITKVLWETLTLNDHRTNRLVKQKST